jgi:hypothetical protein
MQFVLQLLLRGKPQLNTQKDAHEKAHKDTQGKLQFENAERHAEKNA